MKTRPSARGSDLAFLLAQVGAHAAMRFQHKLAPLSLSAPHVGMMRALSGAAGMSQQQLAALLGLHPSRLVALVDELESRGLVERHASPDDRRSHSLQVTDAGKKALADVMRIASKHQDELCAALDPKEREQLAGFLERIVEQQGLTPGVHPGFKVLGKKDRGA